MNKDYKFDGNEEENGIHDDIFDSPVINITPKEDSPELMSDADLNAGSTVPSENMSDNIADDEGEAGGTPQEKQEWADPQYRKSEEETVYSPNYYGEKKGYSSHVPAYEPPKEKRQKTPLRSSVALILVCALVCSLFSGLSAFAVVNYKINKLGLGKQVVIGNGNTLSANEGTTQVSHTGEKLTAPQIYNLAQNQVVGVNSETTTTNIFGQPTSSAVSGTGFVISEDGYILTNYHVIEYAVLYDYDLKVMFYDGKEYSAEIIGYEEENDIAVIKIDASGLSPVTFGDSDSISVGETVYPVGNPLGELSNTMTQGIVSARDRVIATDASTKINMFQFDAAVNKGNSGGPVYNEYGEVIGIVTAKYSETGVEGLGFAIPINDVLDIISQLISTGYVGGKAALGVVVQTMDSSFASYYNVPQGAYIREVTEGSCADKAGLKVGDIIVAFNGEEIQSKEDLISALRKCGAGDTAEVKVHRSGGEDVVKVTLDEKQVTAAQG